MTLQDIHKELDKKYSKFVLVPKDFSVIREEYSTQHIKHDYEKYFIKLIKESMPKKGKQTIDDSYYFYNDGWDDYNNQLIENLKARNINLD